jgi:uncharacterized protein (DUF779 family)
MATNDAPACSITATPEARDALRQLKEQHGDIILHVAGANSGLRRPVCLPAGELRIGQRDDLLGVIEGVPVYQMQSRPSGECHSDELVIDMVEGFPVGFSLSTGTRRRFTIYRKHGAQSCVQAFSQDSNVIGVQHDDY